MQPIFAEILASQGGTRTINTALHNNFSEGGKWSREEKNASYCGTVSHACAKPLGPEPSTGQQRSRVNMSD
jgi:hypothetical protein